MNQTQPNTLIALSRLHRNLNLSHPHFTPALIFESGFTTIYLILFVTPWGLRKPPKTYKTHALFHFLETYDWLFVLLYVCCSIGIYVTTNKNIFSGLKSHESHFLAISTLRLSFIHIFILTFWHTIHSPVIKTSV